MIDSIACRRLREWLALKAKELAHLGINVVEGPRPSANSGFWVDFENDAFIGRITVWPDGNGDVEIINVLSEETIYWKNEPDIFSGGLDTWLATLKTLILGNS